MTHTSLTCFLSFFQSSILKIEAKDCQEGNVVLPGTAKRIGTTKMMSVTLQPRCIRGVASS